MAGAVGSTAFRWSIRLGRLQYGLPWLLCGCRTRSGAIPGWLPDLDTFPAPEAGGLRLQPHPMPVGFPCWLRASRHYAESQPLLRARRRPGLATPRGHGHLLTPAQRLRRCQRVLQPGSQARRRWSTKSALVDRRRALDAPLLPATVRPQLAGASPALASRQDGARCLRPRPQDLSQGATAVGDGSNDHVRVRLRYGFLGSHFGASLQDHGPNVVP